MTDNEKRGLILKEYYKKRKTGDILLPDKLGVDLPDSEKMRIAVQLYEQGLLKGALAQDKDGVGFFGEISADGIDVVEGTRESPISINLDARSYFEGANFGTANVQTGDYSKQEIQNQFEQLVKIIQRAEAPKEEKRALLERLNDFTSHPLAVELFGHLLGGGT